MGILNGISKFFGSTFFGLGISLFLLGLLVGFAIDDVDNLRGKGDEVIVAMFSSPDFLENLMEQGNSKYSGLEEVRVICAENPNEEGCDLLRQIEEDPNTFVQNNTELKSGVDQLNSQIEEMIAATKKAEQISNNIVLASIVLIVLGIVLIYLGWMDWKEAGQRIFVKSAVLVGLAAAYYKLIQTLLIGDLLANEIQIGVVPLEPIKNILAEWINPAFNKIFYISLGIAIISVILAIGIYYLKEKDLKKDNQEK